MYNSALFSNRYKCIKKIGQGGTSSVFLCVDKHINKKWAVKIISDPENEINLIKSEIALLKSFDYYMFPRIVDAFSENGTIGIVTDFIEGESLEKYLIREGPLPVGIALQYFENLLEALIYLHSRSPAILYLDMKPANIMIRPDGQIRLIDFGIANSILLKSKCYGSIGYSPPEQYKADAKLNEKADVFSLAMTLYSMLTASHPHKDLIKQINHIRANQEIPIPVKEIILKCIDPDEQFRPSPVQVLMMLKKYRTGKKGVIPLFTTLVCVCAGIMTVTYMGLNFYKQNNCEKYKKEMLDRASSQIIDGEYTLKGLKIICGYIDGNFLDDSTEEYFTYEVARNYFEVQKDYSMAKSYFKRLNSEKYPDVDSYINKCDEMRRFTDADEEIKILFSVTNK